MNQHTVASLIDCIAQRTDGSLPTLSQLVLSALDQLVRSSEGIAANSRTGSQCKLNS